MGLMDRDYWREKHNPKGGPPSARTAATMRRLQRGLDRRLPRPLPTQRRFPYLTFTLAAAFLAFAVAMYVLRH